MAALNATALWGFICIPPIRAGFFPARRLSKSAAESYFSYVTRSQRFRQSASRWGCFFCSFLVLQYIFSLVFNASFVYFSQFSFGFSFLIFFAYSLCIPCFGVYIMEKPAAVLPAGVIVVVMKSVLLRRRPQVFIKRSLKPSGQKKAKGANEFSGVHIIENIFRTQSSLLGL